MAGSAYVHSLSERWDAKVVDSYITGIDNSFANDASIRETINKLSIIKRQLQLAAEEFLTGYSIEEAEKIADNTGELLKQLANRVLYGTSAYEMATALNRNNKVKVQKIQERLESKLGENNPLVQEILNGLEKDMDSGAFASHLVKVFCGGETHIKISDANAKIVQLGDIFDVEKIQTNLRKVPEIEITNSIFKNSKQLVTHSGGVFRNMIKDLLNTSAFTSTERMGTSVNAFCNKLGKKMKEEAKKDIPFLRTTNKDSLNKIIDKFIADLKVELKQVFEPNGTLAKKMLDISNTIGAIGEEVRASVDKVAENAVVVSFAIGGDTDAVGVNEVNKVLRERGAEEISEMVSYTGGQSLTDVVLLNTRTGKVARAQSKNHFASYFTSQNETGNTIDNFRWKIASGLDLATFIQNLSNTDLGIHLGPTDLNNVKDALVNNIWFSTEGDVELGGTPPVRRLGKINGDDGLKSLEGAFENALAGQITNLLGVTVMPNHIKADTSASNIFYIFNGRMKPTAELIDSAIEQLRQRWFKTFTDKGRMVNVTITKGVVPSPSSIGKDGLSFGPSKVTYHSDEFGQEMADKIFESIKVTVSLGTSIESLKKSSFTALF